MTGERSYAVLPCAELDEALVFYGALGFVTTFVQRRPYPCAVVARDDLQIHLAAISGFDPAASYASVIITAPDLAPLYSEFASGLRDRFGKVPLKGIPRLLPIRRKAGTATGFSLVDVGGNWLRFYADADADADGDADADSAGHGPLRRVIEVAARQADARGDERQAIAVLDSGLLRHSTADPADRFEALLFRAELAMRVGSDPAPDLAAAAAILHEFGLGTHAAERLDTARREFTPVDDFDRTSPEPGD